MHRRSLALISLYLFTCPAFAGSLYGFRWGGPADDAALLQHANKSSDGEFELSSENIRDAVLYDIKKGWKKSSGSGVYFSEDLVDSFGDGRRELFIFELSSSDGSRFPVANGSLGDRVRSFYLEGGPVPPIVSKYTDTWYIIARTPAETQEERNFRIRFHPASDKDSPIILEVFKKNWPETSVPENLGRIFKKIDQRINIDQYDSPDSTLKFLKSFVEKSADVFPSAFSELSPLSQARADLVSSLSRKIISGCILKSIHSIGLR